MPNNWVFGQTIGLGISSDDHVWIIHRGNDPAQPGSHRAGACRRANGPRVSECCIPAPPVMEFDAAGNIVGGWGGPVAGAPYQWPETNHGIVVDHKGFVWIGGNGQPDSHILKFTRDGKFVAQYGKKGARKDRRRRPTSRSTARTASTWKASAASPRSSSIRRPTKATSPTATSTSASRSSTWTAARSSASGAPTASRRRTTTSDRTIRTRRCRASSATRCTARKCRTTASSTRATARTIASRCSRRKASS